jgi:hypothetical protein
MHIKNIALSHALDEPCLYVTCFAEDVVILHMIAAHRLKPRPTFILNVHMPSCVTGVHDVNDSVLA